MSEYQLKYSEYLNFTEESLTKYLDALNCNPVLKEGMKYSVSAGGKRVRPVMFFATLDLLGIDYKKYSALGCAIEFIHTYSLIHDDLPAMDNDDFRRVKPSNHKVFGEGMAILCGDALLNYAFEIAAEQVVDKNTFSAYKYLLKCAGASGMINGQAYDLYYENNASECATIDGEKLLILIDSDKTGKLLTAPLVMACYVANNSNVELFEKLGELTGKLFQFTDDLLDVEGDFNLMGKTLGKDEKSGKVSAVSVYGIDGCKQKIQETYSSIVEILKQYSNAFFNEFYLRLKNRSN